MCPRTNEPQIKPNKFTGNRSNELVLTRAQVMSEPLPVLDLRNVRTVFFFFYSSAAGKPQPLIIKLFLSIS